MTRFNIHPQAQTEFDEAFVNYLGIDPELAVSFEATFFHYLDGIIANPLLYNLRRPPTRRANLMPRFGEYYIAYMIWREKVVIWIAQAASSTTTTRAVPKASCMASPHAAQAGFVVTSTCPSSAWTGRRETKAWAVSSLSTRSWSVTS